MGGSCQTAAMTTEYDGAFFDYMTHEAARSAQAVVPLVLDLLPDVGSVVDVGCGTGAWGHAFEQAGVASILGIDGDYVDRQRVQIQFRPADLASALPEVGTFDLAVCLEVAEHLPEHRADSFVADLVALAPRVLFSAAIPGQGGTDHVNEQWPSYWVQRFATHGYTCWDALRPSLRYDDRVSWFYRQNLLVFARSPVPATLERHPEIRADAAEHFEYVARHRLEPTLRQVLADLPVAVRRKLRKVAASRLSARSRVGDGPVWR